MKFEAGVAFEGFAGLNVGPAKFKGGFQKVYSVSDGEGESFDLNVKDKNIWYFEAEYNGGKFAAKHEQEGGSTDSALGIEVNVPVDFAGSKDVSEQVGVLRQFAKTVNAVGDAGLQAVAEGALAFMKQERSLPQALYEQPACR